MTDRITSKFPQIVTIDNITRKAYSITINILKKDVCGWVGGCVCVALI